MKRTILFLLIFCMLLTGLFAQNATHVTAERARNIGYTFMSTNPAAPASPTRGSSVSRDAMQLVYTGRAVDSTTRGTTDCYYVFALQPKGFVIVAADERVEPVLGYSYNNDFVVEGMPEHVRGWLGNYEQQTKAAIDHNFAPDAEITAKWTRLEAGQPLSSTRSGGTVGPLLTTTWNQGQYYNALCPEDADGPDGHALTGCVATAMAQIINYHQYPQHGRGTHSYESNYGTLTVDYSTASYDYTSLPASLTASSTTAEVNAVATLMRDCGVAVNMGYAADESGSLDQDARAALINFFRYNPDMSFAEKSHFSDDEWSALLRNDLVAGNPVYYSGNGTGGHAFVCDGYNADGYFSFNFGWGGYCNGWYLTSNVSPGSNAFNDSQNAIFGITPDANGNVILGQTAGTSTFTVEEPLEFYHLMGHNAYEVGNYSNPCNSTVNFISANNAHPVVADIVDFEDQELEMYDGEYYWLRRLHGGSDNDLSPVVSSNNTLIVNYYGNLFYTGFKLNISQTDGCRMVSNIGSFIENTTVHLTWTENGNATQWQIEYGIKGFELGTGITDTATTNIVTFSNLRELTEYDFYIRSVCGDNQYSPWNKVSAVIDGSYWQDIVTSQPEGYVYDAATNSVQISTPEGLAWWAKTGSGMDGHLAADIDLSGYKWRPTDLSTRSFHGHGHVVTNAYVRENSARGSFFTTCGGGSIIEDFGIINSYMHASSEVGGMCNYLDGMIRNCYVTNSTIEGGELVGGLVCIGSGTIINCYVNADVISHVQAGLLICQSHGTVRNCYVAGGVRIYSWCYNAGIAAVAQEGEISNCYSVEVAMGLVGQAWETLRLTDVSLFASSGDSWTLSTPIAFDGIPETDLLAALNKGVELYGDSAYYTWREDTENANGGYPVFGNKYAVQCPNVSDVLVQNAVINNTPVVQLSWTDHSDAAQWRIRYRLHNRPDTAYTYVTVTTNPAILYGLTFQSTYDFNVRAVCDSVHQSGWSETHSLIVDLPLWTDVVTSQPAGYVEDADGNVEIYSAEGLAWLSVKTNGLHNQQKSSFFGKTVTLKADINLEGYRWFPIGNYVLMWDAYAEMVDANGDTLWGFAGTFDGQNHTVSNIYMNTNNEHASGLFGFIYLATVKNVILNGGLIIGGGGGGLVDYAYDCYEISNCHSSVTVHSNGRVGDYMYTGYAGSLCGKINNSTPFYSEYYISQHYGIYETVVSNCSASGTVYGLNACGNLIGYVYGNVRIRNCYAKGDVHFAIGSSGGGSYRGGMIGEFFYYPTAYNCFSTGNVEGGSAKVISHSSSYTQTHYIFGQDNINAELNVVGNYGGVCSNISKFHHDGNTNTLLSPVSIDRTPYSDLLDALNAWVELQNDSTLRTWVLDTLTGYPMFGDFFVPSCYNPDSLTVSQATVVGDATIKTRLTWTSVGEPDHWEVLYVASGQNIEFGTIVSVNSNPCVLAGIPTGQPLDFYVRAVCGENDHSGWCGPVTYIPDKLHWTEVVTSQPEGFQEDGNGNVYISSPEGLSWLSSIANGLNGAQYRYYNQIFITRDIDLSTYRWTPISNSVFTFQYSFNGNCHTLSGLYCNELSGSLGLFGRNMAGVIKNLILTQCEVYGRERDVGAILGFGTANIMNCIVKGNVHGTYDVGGLVGEKYGRPVENSCFIGTVDGTNPVGAICGYSGVAITNCYTASTIANNVTKYYYNASSSDFTGSGITWMLNTPSYIGGAFYTDLVDALNAWVDANNTDGQYLRWAADTNMVNGGYPVFESVSLPAVTAQDTVVAQGYYSWHGTVFTSDTVVTETIPTPYGYDSVVTYHIFVTPSPITEITVDTCSSYLWNSEIYSATGDYVQTFPIANDVDSVVILHLTINQLTGVDVQTSFGSYTWIDGVTYVADNHTATYTLQTESGCDSVVTLHLTVNPIPEVSIAGNQHVCETEPVTLTANIGTDGVDSEDLHYAWFVDGQLHDNMAYNLGNSNLFVEYFYPRNEPYHCSVQVTHGDDATCSSLSGEYLVYVHPLPNVSVSATETSICVGGSTTIMAGVNNSNPDNISYSWSDGNFGSSNTFFATSPGSFTFTVTATSGLSDCSSADEITIEVNDIPETPVVTADNAMVFNGSQVTLSVANPIADAVYTWYRNGFLIEGAYQPTLIEFPNTFDDEPAIYNYQVVATLYNSGCVSGISDNTVVTVNPTPAAVVSVEGDNVLCEGNSAFLHVNVTPANIPYTYQWYMDDEPIPGATSVDYVVAESARTTPYDIYLVASANGDYSFTSNVTEILFVSAPAVSIQGSDIIYYGQSTTLTASGADAYEWSTGDHTASITVTPTATTTYTVLGTSVYNCTATASMTVTVDPILPTVITDEVSMITTTGAICGGNVTSEGGADGTERGICWSTTQNPTVSGAHTTDGSGTGLFTSSLTGLVPNTTYYVRAYATNRVGTSYGEEVSFTTLCDTSTYEFSISTCDQYVWNDSTYTESGDYVQTFSKLNGCDSVVTLHLTVNPTPSVQVTASETTICEGGQFGLSVAVDGNAEDIATYTWYKDGLLIPYSTSAYFETWEYPRETPYSYRVVVTTYDGCTSYGDSPDIMVIPSPSVNLSLSDGYNATICDGESTALMANVTGGYGETYYQWYRNGLLLMDEDNPVLYINGLSHEAEDIYEVTVYQSGAGCYSNASAAINTLVTVGPIPSVTIQGANSIAYGESVTLTAYGADSYEWDTGDHTASITVTPTATTTYTVLGTSEYGCTATASVTVTVNPILPTVITDEVSMITTTEALCSGNATSHGGADVTERGICWSTLQNPTVSGAHTSDGSGTGLFTSSLTGLVPNTTYYVRAYATNSVGTAYGEEVAFTTLCNTSTYEFSITTCDSYTWDNSVYTQSGDYSQTLTNAHGCDSVVTLHLTVNPTYAVTDEMTIAPTELPYVWNGVLFTEAGTQVASLQSVNGCDSMVTMTLTVTAVEHYLITVNVSDETPWGTVTGSGSFAFGAIDTLTATAFENYTFVGWSDFNTESTRVITVTQDSTFTAYFVPDEIEEIELTVNDTAMGNVHLNFTGGGEPASVNSLVVITAVPEPHYHFVSWSDGNTENPRTVTLMEALQLTAIFAIDQHTITVLSADESMGTVSVGGTYDYGVEISISAEARENYRFVAWNDSNTENPRTITVEQDSTFTAYFEFIEGIDDFDESNIIIYSNNNQIIIVNAEGLSVEIFDMNGRLIVCESRIASSERRYTLYTSGIYLVNVGKSIIRKVKIIAQ